MFFNLPHEVHLKYAHIFDPNEGFHRVANSENTYASASVPYVVSGVWDRFGFININGIEIVAPIHSWANDFHEGLAFVETTDQRKLFIDYNGNIKLDVSRFDKVYDFSSGLACVISQGKYGFIDKTGYIAVPINFDYIIGYPEFKFNNQGIVGVTVNEKYGIINTKGEYLYDPKYDHIELNWNNPSEPYILLRENSTIIELNQAGRPFTRG